MQLEDKHTLASYSIQAEFTLTLVLRMNILKEVRLQNMQILIKTTTGRIITLELLYTDTIKTVKLMITITWYC